MSSRKFWIAIASVVSGIMIVAGQSATDAQVIAGAIIAVGGAVGFFASEGYIDGQRVAVAIDAVQDAAKVVNKDD